jgi:hypothetical protein
VSIFHLVENTWVHPSYSEFINQKVDIVVKLDKALYGCVESARLWFNDVSSHLKSLEFMQSEVDPCVFYKMENGHTTIIIIYVDDFLMSSKELKHLNSLIESLQTRYKSISVTYGPVIEYLGMNLNFSTPNQVTITMKNKIETILDSYSIASSVISPATDQIFKIRDLPLLSPSLQISMRSTVAKLLYIATHVRPDILLPVNFLCSRSEKFDEDDQSSSTFHRLRQSFIKTTSQPSDSSRTTNRCLNEPCT